MSEYIHIGKIVAAHGLAGHIILEHALGTPIHFKGIDAIFIEKNAASFIPYFIQSASAKTDSLTHLQVEGITTEDGLLFYISNEATQMKPFINTTQQIHTIDLSPFLKEKTTQLH